MAHKPQSYYLGTTKKGKKFIALYDNVEPTSAEQKMIDRFIGLGYEVRFEHKKESITKEQMLEALKNDSEALAKFNAYYSGEKKLQDKDGKDISPFFAACKCYQEWVKKNKEK